MADVARKVAYFAVDISNKPGSGLAVLTALADAGVNLLAFTGFPSGRKAQLDFIPEDAEAFKIAARAAKIKIRPQKFGFLIQGKDRKGVIADLLKALAAKTISIIAMDAVSAGEGRYGAIIWVESKDMRKAASVLGVR
jgi:hypothetical protein